MQERLKPTDEQTAILDEVENSEANLQVNALAGTGKTTTLDFIQSASKKQPILCLAFNKRIAEEMSSKFPDTTTVRTMNSLGHRVWSKAVSNVKVGPKKMQEIFKDYVDQLPKGEKSEAWEVYWPVIEACSLAKALGYVPKGKFEQAKRLISQEDFYAHLETRPTQITKDLIDHLLFLSIKTAYKGWIDYNDQVYMPALFGGTFPRYPFTLVDEGQDLNPVNHAMLRKLKGTRLCVVGDRWQSIYAFRGAVTAGMQILQQEYNSKEFDLSVSFRCPQKVVEAARWRVPNFKWIKPGGRVETLQRLSAREIREGSTIICRNNAPLFRTALGLLMQKRAVTVSGSELGPKLIRLLERICDEADDQSEMLGKIEAWKQEQIEKAQQTVNLIDTAECLAIFASFGKTLSEAVAYVKHMFEQQGAIKLLTGHKAKGGEWDVVYHLDPWLCQDNEQDQNLRYVITTRAKQELYEIDGRDIVW